MCGGGGGGGVRDISVAVMCARNLVLSFVRIRSTRSIFLLAFHLGSLLL